MHPTINSPTAKTASNTQTHPLQPQPALILRLQPPAPAARRNRKTPRTPNPPWSPEGPQKPKATNGTGKPRPAPQTELEQPLHAPPRLPGRSTEVSGQSAGCSRIPSQRRAPAPRRTRPPTEVSLGGILRAAAEVQSLAFVGAGGCLG